MNFSIDQPLGVGSSVVPIADELRNFIAKIREYLRSAPTGSLEEIAALHNEFTLYSMHLLMFCTSSRPVNDPFARVSDLDMTEGFILINDKVGLDAHRNRLAWLPGTALSQLRAYFSHLQSLSIAISSCGIDESATDIEGLYAAIEAQESDGSLKVSVSHRLPLFFLLDKQGIPVQLTPNSVQEYESTRWPFKANAARHVIESDQWGQLPSWIIDIIEGHIINGEHPFGKRSEICHLDVKDQICAVQQRMLDELGWSVEEGLQISPGRPSPAYKPAVSPRWKFGIDDRRERREKRIKRGKELSRLVAEKQDGSLYPLSDDVFKSFLDELLDEYPDAGAEMLLEMRAKSDAILEDGEAANSKSVLLVPVEKSPLDDGWILNYRLARTYRERFGQYFRESDFRSVGNISALWAEVIVSAAANGLTHGEWLLALMKVGPGALKSQDIAIFCDLWLAASDRDGGQPRLRPHWRWVADPVSRGLIKGLFSRLGHNAFTGIVPDEEVLAPGDLSRCLDEADLIAAFQEIGHAIGLRKLDNLPSIAKVLCASFEPYWQLRLPGHLREVLSGRQRVTVLPTNSILRLFSSHYVPDKLIAGKDDPLDEASGACLYSPWKSRVTEKPKSRKSGDSKFDVRTADGLRRWINAQFGKRQKNTKLVMRKKATALREIMEDFGVAAPQSDSSKRLVEVNSIVVCRWLLSLLDHGKPGRVVLSNSALCEYPCIILTVLGVGFGDVLVLDCSDGDLTEFVVEGIQDHPQMDKRRLLSIVKSFFDFVGLHYRDSVGMADWTHIYSAFGYNYQGEADSEVLLPREYEEALAVISSSDLDSTDCLYLTFGLIMGHRFGLRVGEVARLEIQDVQRVGATVLAIQVHGSKTFCGTRPVPLLEVLSESEIENVECVLDAAKIEGNQDIKQRLLFSNSIEEYEAFLSQRLGRLLREVTGNSRFRFQHLRHSWCTRIVFRQLIRTEHSIITRPISLNFSSVVRLIKCNASRRLDAASDLIGHSSTAITLENYFHLLEFCIAHHVSNYGHLPIDAETCAAITGLPVKSVKNSKKKQEITGKDVFGLLGSIKTISGLPNAVGRTERPVYTSLIGGNYQASLKIKSIHRTLLYYGASERHSGSLPYLSGLDPQEVDAVIHHAAALEGVVGYHLYGVRAPGSWSVSSNDPRFSKLTYRTGAFYSSIMRVEDRLDGLFKEDRSRCIEILQAWVETYTAFSDSEILLCSNLRQRELLIDFMMEIGISKERLELRVPKHQMIDHDMLKKSLSSDHPGISVVKSRLSLGSHFDRRSGNVLPGLTFSTGREGAPIGYVAHWNRIMFLACVKARVQSALDGQSLSMFPAK